MKTRQANEYPEMNLELQQQQHCPGHVADHKAHIWEVKKLQESCHVFTQVSGRASVKP